jgi:hypothetical protein
MPARQWTKESILGAIRTRHDAGLSLRSTSVNETDGPLYGAAHYWFGGWSAAVAAAGFDYKAIAGRVRHSAWTADSVKPALRQLLADGLPLASGAVRKHHSGLYTAALQLFGSWDNALQAAGIAPATIRKTLPAAVSAVPVALFTAGNRLPPGFWQDVPNAVAVLRHVLSETNIRLDQAPGLCTRRWFAAHRLEPLLRYYCNSPARLFCALFPQQFTLDMFTTTPAGERSPRTTAHAARVVCTKCTRGFRPDKVHAAAVRCCPFCRASLDRQAETPDITPGSLRVYRATGFGLAFIARSSPSRLRCASHRS